jgi:ABC-2 type transport system permease protein
MDKILAIAKHEFFSNVTRKGYIIFTVMLPLAFVIMVASQVMFGANVPKEIVIERSIHTPLPLPLVLPSIFGAIFALVIFINSGFLLYGMIEEKENRLIEILLTSVSTKQLLLGKVLGLGALGIIQLFMWLMAIGISVTILPALLWMADIPCLQIPAILLILIFFILGYFLFSLILAGIGAMLSDTRQGNQISGIIAVISLIPSWAAIFFFSNPNSGIAVALSYFPLTAPITMVIRLVMAKVPVAETAISLVIIIISIIALAFIIQKNLKQQLLVYEKKIRVLD